MDALNPQTVVTDFNNGVEDSIVNFYALLDTYAYMGFRQHTEYLLIPFIPSGSGHLLFFDKKEELTMTKLFTVPATNIEKLPEIFEVKGDDDFHKYQALNAMTYTTTVLGYLVYVEKDGFLSDFSEESILEKCFEYTTCAIYNLLLLACHCGYNENPGRAAQIVWNTLCFQTGNQYLMQNFEHAVQPALELLHKNGMKPSDLIDKRNSDSYDEDVWQDIIEQYEGSNEYEEDNSILDNADSDNSSSS